MIKIKMGEPQELEKTVNYNMDSIREKKELKVHILSFDNSLINITILSVGVA